MLTHYTGISGLLGILQNGFAWIPNRRHLADLLLPQHDYSKREPQQFGMLSFTELLPEEASQHRSDFGSFGISVTAEWAEKHKAQRVIYVSNEGPVKDALRTAFDVGYRDLQTRIEYPDDAAWQMAFENKAMAKVAGAMLWFNLLTLWEYLEPEKNSHQSEWRIVNKFPFYSLSENKAETIAAVSPPVGWAIHMNVLTLSPNDVSALVCPTASVQNFKELLPAEYRDVKLILVD